jgi:hypothetical protein
MVIMKEQNKIAYEKGQREKTCSCSLENLCNAGYEMGKYGVDKEGTEYQIFNCFVKTGK